MKTLFVFSGIVLGLCAKLEAQGNWTANGPNGGHIISLALHPANPDIVYAGCDDSGGIYKTTDGGETWRLATATLPDVSGWTVAIDPHHPEVVYGGDILGLGAYKTSDGGQTWQFINAGLNEQHVSCMVVRPDSVNVVYAGTGGFRFAGDGIYKSRDAGVIWAPSGLAGVKVYCLTINPDSTSIIYAGTHGNGLYKSTDAGASWFSLPAPLPAVMSIAINPDSPNILYASAFDPTHSAVYKSIDAGTSWQSLGLDNQFTWSLTIDPASTNIIYAATLFGGVYKSIDSGQNWNPVNSGISTPVAFSLVVNPNAPDILYTGFYAAGVYKSVNGGALWRQKIQGLRNTYIFGLAKSPGASRRLYASNAYGFNGGFFFKSVDGGQSWNSLTPPGYVASIISLAGAPVQAETFYAGAIEGIIKTTDQGSSWTLLHALPSDEDRITAIAIDPTAANIIYATAYVTSNPDTGMAVLKSTDDGRNWNQVGFFQKTVSSIALHPESDILYGGALALNPASPQIIYAGAFGGVFKSTDSGSNWNPAGLTGEAIFTLAISPDSANVLYAGCESGKVYQSVDSGGHWTRIDPGWSSAMITDILIDPSSANTIYVARDASDWHPGIHGGIAMSNDGGLHWTEISAGISTTHTTKLAIDESANILYAATYGGGIFRQDLVTSVTAHEDPVSPEEIRLFQNYPNPFNPETTIRYQLPEAGQVTFVIYNLLGQQVRTLVAQNQPVGNYTVVWDGRNDTGEAVASGMYFYKLKIGETFTTTRKMLLLR